MQKEPAILAGLEDKYVALAQIIVSDLFFAKSLSFIVDQAEYDSLAVALVNISMEAGNTLSIIREIVASEFERNFREPGSILRGNCVASKMMGAFSRKVGADYLRQCIGSMVQDIARDSSLSLEIDPVKIKENTDESVKKNSAELLKRTTKILESIIDPKMMENMMPVEIKAIAGFTAEYAKIYCPDRLEPLIGGFIMLRLFNPSLVTPEAFGIIENTSPLSREARRNLTLITKLLQNLSNGVPFGSKETYMVPMNKFITENQQKMNDFLSRVAVAAQSIATQVDTQQESKKLAFSALKAKDLELLHQLLYNYKDKILALLAVEVSKHREKEFTAEEELFKILDELGPPKRKPRPRHQDNLGLSFLTPPEKSGYITKKSHSRSISILGDTKRLWVVLTGGFLHFFQSPQNTTPLRSISLDEIWTSGLGEKDNTLGFSFTLNYYRKEHLMYLQNEEDVIGWSEAIKNVKEKFGRMEKREVNERLRPIEVRIRNHSMGLKVAYNVTLPEFDWDKNSRIHFVLEVEAFSNSYKITKTLSDFKELKAALVKTYPRIIFPMFPKKIGEETNSGMPLGRYNGRASFAVSVMLKFLRSFFHEIKSNLLVQQSEIVLDFLGLMCPIKAVEHNHIAQLSRLLQMSVDFNKHDPDGYTALHRAVELDRIEAVKWLSNCSTVHINSKDNNGNSALILAIELNKIELVKILIDAGAETKLKNNVRSSPLHIAASMGLKEICELLIEKGVKIDELNMKRKSPLHYAINHRYPDVAMLLLSKGANTSYTDTFGNTLLALATAARLPTIVKYLLDTTDIKVNTQGRYQATALHFAAANGCVESAKELLAHRADPLIKDIQQCNCLFTSVRASTVDVFEILVEHCKKKESLHLDQEHFGSYLIHKAASSPQADPIIRTLFAYSANINAKDYRGRTPLHIACVDNNIPAISVLLELGADPSVEDSDKRTPLYLVSYKGYETACKMLLDHKADPNTIDVDGTTPLHASIWNCKLKITKLLVDASADVNRTEFFQGNSPLHIAIQMRHFEIADFLLKNDANPNCQRISDGQTPLHWSIDCEFYILARYLAKLPETDITIKNKSGETPIGAAISRNANPEFIKLLKVARSESAL